MYWLLYSTFCIYSVFCEIHSVVACGCTLLIFITLYVSVPQATIFTGDGRLGYLESLCMVLWQISLCMSLRTCVPAFLLGISPQVKFCFRRSCQTSLFYLYTFYIHLFFEFSLQHFDVDISSPLTDEKTRAQKDTVSSQGHRASEQQGQGMNLDLSGSAVCIFSIT